MGAFGRAARCNSPKTSTTNHEICYIHERGTEVANAGEVGFHVSDRAVVQLHAVSEQHAVVEGRCDVRRRCLHAGDGCYHSQCLQYGQQLVTPASWVLTVSAATMVAFVCRPQRTM